MNVAVTDKANKTERTPYGIKTKTIISFTLPIWNLFTLFLYCISFFVSNTVVIKGDIVIRPFDRGDNTIYHFKTG